MYIYIFIFIYLYIYIYVYIYIANSLCKFGSKSGIYMIYPQFMTVSKRKFAA